MEPRLKPVARLFSLLLAVLVIRLAILQIALGARYARLSDRNRIRQVVRPAPRGRIFDRKGRIVADSRPSFTAVVTPTETDSATIVKLAAALSLPADWLLNRLKPVAAWSTPVPVKRNLSFEEVALLLENSFRLAGVSVRTEPLRSYPLGPAGAHLIGYVAEPTAEELRQDTSVKNIGHIGRTGIEAQYEKILRGRSGIEFVEVDARGREIGPLKEKRPEPAIPGQDLYLTIDSELQQLAWQLTEGYDRAAVVMLEVKTGAVLCLVSRPAFDPEMFLGRISTADWQKLSDNPSRPFLNRAVAAGYPPGSTMKPIVALAGLSRRVIDRNSRFQPCNGSLRYGNRTFRCWGVHGSTDLVEALAFSCNVYFYQLGQRIGLDNLTAFARSVAMGSLTGIDIPGERAGNIPTRQWLDKRYGRNRWGAGSLLNFSIGQGEVLATPLQMAWLYAAIANNGVSCRPHIVDHSQQSGQTSWQSRPETNPLPLSEKSLAVVRLGLDRVVEYGTGSAARSAELSLSGKTGTAQAPPLADHAWFVGYAPSDDPEVAFAVLVENAGHGGSVAAPIARQLVHHWFFGNSSPVEPDTSLSPAAPETIPTPPGNETP